MILRLGDERVDLRCTLRAAMTIDARFGSFAKAIEQVAAGDVSAAAAIVAIGAGRTDLNEAVFASGVESLVQPLAAFLVLLANGGKPFEENDTPEADGKTMTRAEFYERLLTIGMGWLGWTEQATLDTTMPAILTAYTGRVEMLKAIFGGGDEAQPAEPEPVTQEKLQSIFRMACE